MTKYPVLSFFEPLEMDSDAAEVGHSTSCTVPEFLPQAGGGAFGKNSCSKGAPGGESKERAGCIRAI